MGKRARIQTGLRLDSGTVDRLRKSGRALSDEIRDRLERTFKEDASDPVTRELQQAVADIAELVRQDFGDWHHSRRAHAVFAAMLARHLAGYAPPKVPQEGAVADLFGPEIDDSAEAVSAIAEMRVRDNRRAHPYPHLERAVSRANQRRISSALRRMKAKPEGEKP